MGLYLFVMSLNWSAYQTWYQIKLHLLCVSFLFFSTFKSTVSYIYFFVKMWFLHAVFSIYFCNSVIKQRATTVSFTASVVTQKGRGEGGKDSGIANTQDLRTTLICWLHVLSFLSFVM